MGIFFASRRCKMLDFGIFISLIPLVSLKRRACISSGCLELQSRVVPSDGCKYVGSEDRGRSETVYTGDGCVQQSCSVGTTRLYKRYTNEQSVWQVMNIVGGLLFVTCVTDLKSCEAIELCSVSSRTHCFLVSASVFYTVSFTFGDRKWKPYCGAPKRLSRDSVYIKLANCY
jgi:hypothetical protein